MITMLRAAHSMFTEVNLSLLRSQPRWSSHAQFLLLYEFKENCFLQIPVPHVFKAQYREHRKRLNFSLIRELLAQLEWLIKIARICSGTFSEILCDIYCNIWRTLFSFNCVFFEKSVLFSETHFTKNAIFNRAVRNKLFFKNLKLLTNTISCGNLFLSFTLITLNTLIPKNHDILLFPFSHQSLVHFFFHTLTPFLCLSTILSCSFECKSSFKSCYWTVLSASQKVPWIVAKPYLIQRQMVVLWLPALYVGIPLKTTF